MTLQAWVIIAAAWSAIGISGITGYLFSPRGVRVHATWRTRKRR